jgi:hyperosmotically inducible protein
MRHIQRIVTAALWIGAAACYGQTTPTQPDNTKVNARDRSAGAVTADQQKSDAADMKLTKTIRQSIMADKSLSTYAHNVKIISQNGMVTLKGPVKSDAEKTTVISKAVAAAGSADKVTDQISIKH